LFSRTCRSTSANRSSTKILHPSCSPKKLTLLPTTGPRSSRTGVPRDVSIARNFFSALVAKTGSSTAIEVRDRRGSTSLRRVAMRLRRPIYPEVTSEKSKRAVRSETATSRTSDFDPPASSALGADALRLGRRLGLRGGLRSGLRRLLRRRGLALHVDVAAEVRALGDRHARRDDIAVDRAVVADIDLVGG